MCRETAGDRNLKRSALNLLEIIIKDEYIPLSLLYVYVYLECYSKLRWSKVSSSKYYAQTDHTHNFPQTR